MFLKFHGFALGAALIALSPSSALADEASVQPVTSDRHGTTWLNIQMKSLSARNSETGWSVTPSGLRWRRIAGDGQGVRPRPTDKITVHYVGTFVDGEEFDSSIRRGEPISFALGQVIKGWQEGLALAGVGDMIELAIPYNLGYGAAGKGPIPGGATLLFTVELIAVESAATAR